jgi:adenosylcobinamide-GDP ribazoletransferase
MTDTPETGDATPPADGRGPQATAPNGPKAVAVQMAQALRFYSRLPVPPLPFESDPHAVPDFVSLPRVVPAVGAVLGAVGAVVLLAGLGAGIAPLPASACAIAALAISTGCMSEDGLADAADGLYGGANVERRLAIMRDSQVGSYGVAAVALALILRVAALSTVAEEAGAWPAALALVASGGLSRLAGLVPLWALRPARSDGRSASVGRPSDAAMRIAVAVAAGLGLVLIGPTLGPGHAVLALLVAGLAAFLATRIARRKLGGQTGDVAGATQQVAEAAMLLVLGAGLA